VRHRPFHIKQTTKNVAPKREQGVRGALYRRSYLPSHPLAQELPLGGSLWLKRFISTTSNGSLCALKAQSIKSLVSAVPIKADDRLGRFSFLFLYLYFPTIKTRRPRCRGCLVFVYLWINRTHRNQRSRGDSKHNRHT